jgi:hypothetical protein
MRKGISLEIEVIENKPVEYRYNPQTQEYQTIEKARYGIQLYVDKMIHISKGCRSEEIKPYMECFMESIAQGLSEYGNSFTANDGLNILRKLLEKE